MEWAGIAGDNWGNIYRCYNTADVTSTNTGGIACSTSGGGTIIECYNTGNIRNSSNSSGGYAGGISGFLSGVASIAESYIKNCYNVGKISGNDSIGGICGEIPTDSCSVSNCYNVGNIVATEKYGGIVGNTSKAKVVNSYYLENENLKAINGEDDLENNVTSKTDSEMKSSDFVDILNNSDNIWKSYNDDKYNYPILNWQTDIKLNDDVTDEYYIYTEDDLRRFVSTSNMGENWENKNIYLMNDITLNVSDIKPWESIEIEFQGIFEGNEHFISGMNGKSGLFSTIGNSGVVRNITIQNSTINSSKTYVGRYCFCQ